MSWLLTCRPQRSLDLQIDGMSYSRCTHSISLLLPHYRLALHAPQHDSLRWHAPILGFSARYSLRFWPHPMIHNIHS